MVKSEMLCAVWGWRNALKISLSCISQESKRIELNKEISGWHTGMMLFNIQKISVFFCKKAIACSLKTDVLTWLPLPPFCCTKWVNSMSVTVSSLVY